MSASPSKVALPNAASPIKMALGNQATRWKVAPTNIAVPLKMAAANAESRRKVEPMNRALRWKVALSNQAISKMVKLKSASFWKMALLNEATPLQIALINNALPGNTKPSKRKNYACEIDLTSCPAGSCRLLYRSSKFCLCLFIGSGFIEKEAEAKIGRGFFSPGVFRGLSLLLTFRVPSASRAWHSPRRSNAPSPPHARVRRLLAPALPSAKAAAERFCPLCLALQEQRNRLVPRHAPRLRRNARSCSRKLLALTISRA